MIKKFLLLLLPISLLLGAVFWLFYHLDIKAQEQLIASKSKDHINMHSNTITYNFQSVISDLTILSQLHELQQLVDNIKDYSSKELENHFLSISLIKGLYDQIRFIDTDGQEILRVNYNNGKPVLAPKNQLQNKAERYYFKKTMALPGGEVYISPLDLNVENGEVERPFKPVIRFGAPILNSKGEKRGALILNLLAKSAVIDNFKNAVHHRLGQHDSLLNSEGYWLAAHNPENEWGFMLEERKDKTFGAAHPITWKRILSEETGQFQTDEGLFTFITLYPFLAARNFKDFSETANSFSFSGTKAYFWKIVSFVSQEALDKWSYEESAELRSMLTKLYAALLLLVGFGVFFFALAKEKEKQAEQERKEIGDKIKAIVATVGEGIISIDMNSVIRFVNKELCNIFGHTEKELVGENMEMLIPEKYKSEHVAGMKRYLDGGTTKILGTRLGLEGLRKDGSTFPLELRIEETRLEGDRGRIFIAAIRDITERKRAEDTIKKSEESIRLLLESTVEGIYGIDLDGKCTFVNPSCVKLLGYDDINQLMGKNMHGLMHHTRKDGTPYPMRECRIYQEFREGKATHADDAILWRADGTSFPAEYWSHPIYQDDKVRGAVVTFVNITERIRAESALKESEERFALAQKIANIGTWEYDFNSNLFTVSDEVEPMFGFRANEVELNYDTFLKAIHDDDRQRVSNAINASVKKDEDCNIEYRILWSDKTIHWISAVASVFRDDSGNPIRMVGIIQEVTERKEAGEALLQSELWMRCIYNSLDEAVFVMSPDRKIVNINKAVQKIFGYSAEEMKNLTTEVLHVDHEHYVEFGDCIRQAFEKGQSAQFESVSKRKNGEIFTSEHEVSLLKDPTGKHLGIVSVVRDITKRKEAEMALIVAKGVAEKATKLKDKFVSLIAHDLKSPLGTLINTLELIQNNSKVELSGDIGKAFGFAKGNAHNMINLIDNILDTGRFKSGQIKLNLKFIDGFYSSTKAVMTFDEMSKAKGIELVNEVKPETRLYADPILFEEVIKNLLSNAIKFCKRGDRITVYTPEGNKTAIAVKDTGPGIPKNILPDMFKEDVKTSTIGTAGETGTGLGLPYCQDIMKDHGGNLTVESEEGRGAVFTASLPFVKPKILVIDDQETSMYIVDKMLGSLEVELIKAYNGQEALDLLKETKPYLIIADLYMPGMDGFTFIQRIKSNPSFDYIPVIVLTFDSSAATRDKALKLGADDFVEKELMYKQLSYSVKKYVV